jgi:L-seryl-tRNA(Ser) seleniumtransferase
LKVHPSNYRVVGFTSSPGPDELAAMAREAGLPFVFDLGSGLLRRYPGVPPDEPSAEEALAHADLVTFSGDKLLGGPQSGIVLGRLDLVAVLRRHAIARAVRVDKMGIAALERVLVAYVRDEQPDLPVWRMLLEPGDAVRRRADALAASLDGRLQGARVAAIESVVGGGSMPGYAIPSWGVFGPVANASAVAARLRTGLPPVVCRVDDGAVVFDLRTVPEERVEDLSRAIVRALEGDDVADDG